MEEAAYCVKVPERDNSQLQSFPPPGPGIACDEASVSRDIREQYPQGWIYTVCLRQEHEMPEEWVLLGFPLIYILASKKVKK